VQEAKVCIEILTAMQGEGLEFTQWGNGFRPIAEIIKQLNEIVSMSRRGR
jgi:hypothetical protein